MIISDDRITLNTKQKQHNKIKQKEQAINLNLHKKYFTRIQQIKNLQPMLSLPQQPIQTQKNNNFKQPISIANNKLSFEIPTQTNDVIIGLQDYKRLQTLLQLRQQQIRKHIKIQYQLRLCIEDLEDKKTQLSLNNQQIIISFKNEILQIRKQNQQLRTQTNNLHIQNQQIKKLCKSLQTQLTQTSKSFQTQLTQTRNNESNRRAINNQVNKNNSIIKVIETQGIYQSSYHKQIKTLKNSILSDQCPILQPNISINSKHKSQSKQKLKVTIKQQSDKISQSIIKKMNNSKNNSLSSRSINRFSQLKKHHLNQEQQLATKKPMSHQKSRIYSCFEGDNQFLNHNFQKHDLLFNNLNNHNLIKLGHYYNHTARQIK